MENYTLGQKIREARKSLNLSQRELAELSNFTLAQISKIENDSYRPYLHNIIPFESILKVDLKEQLLRLGYNEKEIYNVRLSFTSKNP